MTSVDIRGKFFRNSRFSSRIFFHQFFGFSFNADQSHLGRIKKIFLSYFVLKKTIKSFLFVVSRRTKPYVLATFFSLFVPFVLSVDSDPFALPIRCPF